MIEYLCDGHGDGVGGDGHDFYGNGSGDGYIGGYIDGGGGRHGFHGNGNGYGDGNGYGGSDGYGGGGGYAKSFLACPDPTDLAAALVNVVVRPR